MKINRMILATLALFSIFSVAYAQSAPIWQTGQTLIYRAGDDGDLRHGISWPSPRLIDNGDGTVTDNLPGLMWLKDTNCMVSNYSGFDNDGTTGDGRVTWQHALEFVAGINNGEYPNCGSNYNDWRLPNRKELFSIVDYSRYNPVLPQRYLFTNVQSNQVEYTFYWSSTSFGQYAWLLDMFDGRILFRNKNTGYYVWPVRGGQAGSFRNLTISYPNGGESLLKGQDYTITWDSVNVSGNIQIGLYKGGTEPENMQLSAITENDGEYPFNPPDSLADGDDYLIGISAENGTVWDFSGSFFTIQSSPQNQIPIIDSFTSDPDPATGEPPLNVTFTCTAHDDDGWIDNYTIDYGDGSDTETNSTGVFSKTYGDYRNYQATCRAFDNEGAVVSSDPLTIRTTTIPVLIVPGIMGSLSTDLFCNHEDAISIAERGISNFLKSNFEIPEQWTLDPILDTYTDLRLSIARAGFSFLDVPYDWRMSIPIIVTWYLEPAINQAKLHFNTDTVDIVAHSMGGLVVRYYIQSDNYQNDIGKFAMIGTPQRGSIDSYSTWEGGDFNGSLFNYKEKIFKEVFIENMKLGCGYLAEPDISFIRTTIPSVGQLMPTFPYIIRFGDYVPIRDMCSIGQNDFLMDLNSSLIKLLDSGVDLMIFASDTEETLKSIKVKIGSFNQCDKEKWPDGEVRTEQYEKNGGDKTVLFEESAFPAESIPLFQRIPVKKVYGKHGELPSEFLVRLRVVEFLEDR